MNELKILEQELNDVGYTVMKDFFTVEDISAFETCILELLFLQSQKIGEYREKSLVIQDSDKSNFEKFSILYEMMEKNDKEALYQFAKFTSFSLEAKKLFDDRFVNLCASLLGSNKNRLLIEGPGLIANRPNTQRLLYKWHSEAHYYPKRRRFLNIWLPLFDSKTKFNGTMSFKEKSHKRDFPFSDYRGYNKDTQNESNYFTQYEIPFNLLEHYEEHWCEVSPRDMIIFHRNLVHRSNPNNSNNYSFAVVARMWDPTDDLTLSGSLDASVGKNVGRSNLIVDFDVK